jgi:hypothetical protein
MSRPEEEYREFVGSRAASLHRTAYLLCGDWHLANFTLTTSAAELRRAASGKANPKADTGPAYQEAITINADTGIPLNVATGPAGKVTGIVSYVVTRVSLADIAAGRF